MANASELNNIKNPFIVMYIILLINNYSERNFYSYSYFTIQIITNMSRTISRVMSLNDHLSRAAVTNSFKRPTWKRNGQLHSFLFGLASDGVYMCPPCYQRGGSPLHYPSNLTTKVNLSLRYHKISYGGTFLLHWPWSHLHRTLSGILPCEARTFLTCLLAAAIICLTFIFNY